MAKIKYSALVSEMRNKLNGSVLSKNRYGNYVRNKVTPVNPQTVYQQAQRSALAGISASWRNLAQSERDSWINAAKSVPRTDIFGDSKILSGQAFFLSANLNLGASNSALITSPGISSDLGNVVATAVNISVDFGNNVVSFEAPILPTVLPTGSKLVVYATDAVSPGIAFVKNRYRYLGTFTPTAGVLDLTAEWSARFGQCPVGYNVFLRLALVSTDNGSLGIPSGASGSATT